MKTPCGTSSTTSNIPEEVKGAKVRKQSKRNIGKLGIEKRKGKYKKTGTDKVILKQTGIAR